MLPRNSVPVAGLFLAVSAFSTAATADVPKVVADTAPVHSLAAQVMGDLGTPDLILPPGASPHGYAMRPSQARALAGADVVFWIGEDLTPWLSASLETLAGRSEVVELAELPGVTVLEVRDNAAFTAHSHGDEDGHGDADDGHDTPGAEDPAHEVHSDSGHDHGAHDHDPHLWLDPDNAVVWLRAMAEALSAADPENAATYAANAEDAAIRLGAQSEQIAAELAPLQDLRFVVFHDAYQYFEYRFGLTAVASISVSDATDPSAARVAEVRRLVRELGVTCVATEPQFNPGLVETISEGTEVVVTVLDPVGTAFEPGPGLYSELLQGMADGLLACR